MSKTSMILVDDHPLIRRGIHQLLAMEPSFDVVAEASNGAEAIALAVELKVDLILLDLNMKGMSGLDTLKALRKEGVKSKIIILTVSDHPLDIHALIEAKADGYLLKDMEPEALVEHLILAAKGEAVYSERVLAYKENKTDEQSLIDSLTEREFQILQEVAKGHRNKQIAETLFISEATVKVHMKSLLKKLQVSSRTAATVFYLEHYPSMN